MNKVKKKAFRDTTGSAATLVWFRRDLRLQDNPALLAALKRKIPVIPIFVWSTKEESPWIPGDASRYWLFEALCSLSEELKQIGSQLIIRSGDTLAVLQALIKETGADALFFNRRFEPHIQNSDQELEQKLGVEITKFNASLLYEPSKIRQKNGKPYQVFSAYFRACMNYGDPPVPSNTVVKLINPTRWPNSLTINELKQDLRLNQKFVLEKEWKGGLKGGQKQLKRFTEIGLPNYAKNRDRPDLEGVSKLSPYLSLGQISSRQIFDHIRRVSVKNKKLAAGAQVYLKELIWREFAYYLLFHFPQTPHNSLRDEYRRFPWKKNDHLLQCWQKGETGYPIVDAGMRQLKQIGWMHNRVRMIVSSFLVKDLFIDWQTGALWFWENLIDADLANNTLGWQWTAGCGADAAPYFRIFNPVNQGQKFDPQGEYVKKFVPELKNLPIKYIHAPWLANKQILEQSGIFLGRNYPYPIVNHTDARNRALAAWHKMMDNKREHK